MRKFKTIKKEKNSDLITNKLKQSKIKHLKLRFLNFSQFYILKLLKIKTLFFSFFIFYIIFSTDFLVFFPGFSLN